MICEHCKRQIRDGESFQSQNGIFYHTSCWNKIQNENLPEVTYSVHITVPVVVERLSQEIEDLTHALINIMDVFSCGIDPDYGRERTRIGFTSRTPEGMYVARDYLLDYFKNRKGEI